MAANPVSPISEEQALRSRFGIPPDARRVLVFAESSHWDPNWLYTSETYYTRFVKANLDRAIGVLESEPRRVYSVECTFFLRLYWDRCPEQRERLAALLNEGRLRLTGSGVTTADTLLPSAEAIWRDFLLGQEWLRANGISQEPRLAYFTDSFGCSSSLPTLLRAAGFDRTALTRVDGMYFQAADYEPARNFPRPGSTAELLLKREKTLDFVWRDGNGAEVLCHWNAFTYGQGDMLAFRGLNRIYLFPIAWPARSERFVARRIAQFVDQLDPYRRTPYMFCPIGFDFVPPIDGLVALLDRYNRVRYPSTGVWAVNAGLDDYLTLVDCCRDRLPTLQIDPNPYWTGFYTARPALKRRCRDLVDRLLLAERLALLPGNADAATTKHVDLSEAWWDAASSNHHDFITGTSPDAVVEQEQLPWLDRATRVAQSAIRHLAANVEPLAVSPKNGSRLPEWHREGDRWVVQTPHYAVELDGQQGGCIAGAWHPDTQQPLLAGPSNDLVAYHDSGGLWRMGCEFRGGTWEAVGGDMQTRCQAGEDGGALCVTCESVLDGERVRSSLWFDGASPAIRGRVEGRVPEDVTVTVRFVTGLSARCLAMGEPGGVVVRPPTRIYTPTFWPAQQFVHLHDEAAGRGLVVLLSMPGAVSYASDGTLELVALRNATHERAFGFVPFLPNPAVGHEREPYAFDYALLFVPGGDWQANALFSMACQYGRNLWPIPEYGALVDIAGAAVHVSPPSTIVSALKPASRGKGIVVRLTGYEPRDQPVNLSLPGRKIERAWLCDARERDLEPLTAHDGCVEFAMRQPVATLRLHVSRAEEPG